MNPEIIFQTRADLARDVPEAGVMVELGVARGRFAVQLILANPEAFYLGIDRYSDRGHDEAQFRAARDFIASAGGRAARLVRETFHDALPRVGDGVADLVYVDGYAHTGQDDGRTLRDWWPKVKPGGIFAGHDYCEAWPKTVAVVDAFVLEHGLEIHVIDEKPYPSWWVRKPD